MLNLVFTTFEVGKSEIKYSFVLEVGNMNEFRDIFLIILSKIDAKLYELKPWVNKTYFSNPFSNATL